MAKVQGKDISCKVACPAGIDIPRCHRLVSEGKWDAALAVIRERVPFTAVIGRVCFSPCEAQCRLGETWREPIAIRALHRLVAEKASVPPVLPVTKSSGKSVAIIGSGPAGLTAAYYLAMLGHKAVVFEALPKPGGMLRVGIPDYRLPKEILDKDIHAIERLGVEIKTNTKVESIDNLLEEKYDAVIVAIGAHRGVKMGIEAEDTTGVIDGISLLRDISLGKEVKLGERVVVIGGGNSAIDTARVALRLGAKEVTIVYRRSREEMPASASEIEEAIRERIKIEFLAAPTKIRRTDGKVEMDCVRMKLGELDASGRRRPEPIQHSKFRINADAVISAIGQLPDIPPQFGLATTNENVIKVIPDTLATTKEGVFAAGDAVGGIASVINAIAEGRQVAISVDKYLGGDGIIDKALAPPEGEEMPQVPLSLSDRASMPSLSIGERLTGFAEVELGLLEEAGIEEAKRCFWCDLEPIMVDVSKCVTCMSCQLWCSFVYTGMFNLEESGNTIEEISPGVRELTFGEDCIGCSICARQCTFKALALKKKEGG